MPSGRFSWIAMWSRIDTTIAKANAAPTCAVNPELMALVTMRNMAYSSASPGAIPGPTVCSCSATSPS